MDTNNSDYRRTKDWTLWRLKIYSKSTSSGCIEWQKAKSRQGYGIITIKLGNTKSRVWYCHRALWELTHDVSLERSIYVCHKCDNTKCININHLFIGTAKDNQQDMAKKGRAGNQGRKLPFRKRGKYKPHKRLREHSDEKIRAIKAATGPLREVADLYGVSMGYVSKLRNGKAKTLV